MSAADGVTRGSDAQRPDHVGATGASAIDTEHAQHAQHAQPFTEANRDRSPSDADEIRSRNVFENERSDATDATAAEALDDEESLAIRAAERLSYVFAKLRKQLFAYQFVVLATVERDPK